MASSPTSFVCFLLFSTTPPAKHSRTFLEACNGNAPAAFPCHCMEIFWLYFYSVCILIMSHFQFICRDNCYASVLADRWLPQTVITSREKPPLSLRFSGICSVTWGSHLLRLMNSIWADWGLIYKIHPVYGKYLLKDRSLGASLCMIHPLRCIHACFTISCLEQALDADSMEFQWTLSMEKSTF